MQAIQHLSRGGLETIAMGNSCLELCPVGSVDAALRALIDW